MSNSIKRSLRMTAVGVAGVLLAAVAVAGRDYPAETSDGLAQVSDSSFDVLYGREGAELNADLRAYTHIMIAEEIPVEFRDNWQRDQNRFRGPPNDVEQADAARIRDMMADSLRKVLTRELGERGTYPVVTKPGMGVLLLKPSIVELDVFAPDILTPNVTRVFTQSVGKMTLQMDLYDAVTNELVGRIIDQQLARDQRFRLQLTNRVINRFESEIIMRRWGARLRAMLDDSRAS